MIWSQWRDFAKTWVSIPEYHAYRERLRGLEGLALPALRGPGAADTRGPGSRIAVGVHAAIQATASIRGASGPSHAIPSCV
jgi:hypothetical protein